MNTKTYNGWTNYETWLVKLWIDNDEGSQSYWIDRTREVYEASLPDKTFSQTENAALTLMKELESEHEEALPTLQGFAADLLSAAMSEVNWHEIAASLIEDNADAEVEETLQG